MSLREFLASGSDENYRPPLMEAGQNPNTNMGVQSGVPENGLPAVTPAQPTYKDRLQRATR